MMVSLFAATWRIGISDQCFTFSQKSMVHGLALPQDTRPWCLRLDRDQCCATYSSNGAVAAIMAGAGTQYSPIGAALLTRMAPALCTRPLALAPRSGWRQRMYSATGADVAYTIGVDAMYSSLGAGTAITTGARAVCSSAGAGAAITADTGAMYTSSGAGAGMKYPSTGAGAQNTADAGAMYSSIGAGAEITADAGAVYSSTGVGVAITADADTMCSCTGAGAGITADAGVKYPSNGAGAQYTASAGATGVLLPVKVPSVYDLAHTTTP